MRLLLFDIDGTLIDTAGAGRRAIVRAFHDELGLDGIDAHARDLRFAGMTDWWIFETLAQAVGAGAPWTSEAMERLRAGYLVQLRAEMARTDERRRVLPGVRELLGVLAGIEDVHLGLITGNLEPGARIKLEAFGLNGHFPGGGFGSDAPDRRDVARIAVEKLSRLHGTRFEPHEVFVVGDTVLDVGCAHANGFRSVAVAAGWHPAAELARADPDVLLESMADLEATLRAFGLGDSGS